MDSKKNHTAYCDIDNHRTGEEPCLMERGFRDPPDFFGSQVLKPSREETENHLEFR